MNKKLKHLIVAIFSFVLLLGMLYVPGLAKNSEEMKKIEFGYPSGFIFEDFSKYDQSFHFFPRYQRFEFKKEILVGFSFLNFLADFLIFFAALEILIFILENLVFWVKNVFFKEKEEKGAE